MFCPQCGKPVLDGAKFCVDCGFPIGSSPDPKYIQVIQLRCKHCDGIMTVDPETHIIACKYCGSKELIVENSKVTIERIRSKTARDIREIDYKQHESEKDLELEKLYYEEKKTVRKEKREWKALGIVYLIFFLFIGGIFFAASTREKKEIAAGKIRIPSADEAYIGEQYYIVEMELKDAGFSNVNSKPLNDLSEESSDDIGKVYKIIVNGHSDFSAQTLFSPDANIFIYYHSTDDN